MLNCPACSNPLTEKTVDKIKIDVCENGCGGLWFDQLEIIKVDEPHEGGGETLLDIKRNPAIKVDHTKRRNCPVCPSSIMMRHFFSIKRSTEVDECPSCAGFWIDAGELQKIRQEFTSDEARDQAALAYFGDVFNNDLAKLRSQGNDQKAAANRIANTLKWLCPSYWIPGDQKGGAF